MSSIFTKIINKDLYLDTYKLKDQLKDPDKFIGYRGTKEKPSAIILKNDRPSLPVLVVGLDWLDLDFFLRPQNQRFCEKVIR